MKKNFKNKYCFEDVKGLMTLNHLGHVMAEPVQKLKKIANTSDSYYKPFESLGKNGKKRKIDRPTGDLKKIQKKIADRVLKLYPLTDVTFGAVPGKSTKDNAQLHTRKKVVVRIDLSDCFHSIKSEWVYRCFRKRFGYSKSVSKLLTELCTFNGSIPVGSPLSSMLVNIVLDPLWLQVKGMALNSNSDASVWVDDLLLSGDEAHKLIDPVKKLINRQGLKIGWHKLDIMWSKNKQEGTGCSLNFAVGVPKRKRIEYARKAIAKAKDGFVEHSGHVGYTGYIKPTQGKQLEKLVNRINRAFLSERINQLTG